MVRDRRGFILATTLLVMTLLTVMLVATFVTISAEFRTTNASWSMSRSLNLAQSGLQNYFAYGHSLGTGLDSTNYTLPGGYARVVARRLRDSTANDRALWIVYSTGVDTTRSLTIQGTGQRTVAQFAYLSAGALPARAALVAANGVILRGNGGNPVSGRNKGFTLSGCTIPPSADTFGLTVPVGGYTDSTHGNSPGGKGINGMEVLPTAGVVIDSTRIDWPKLVAGEFTPDYVNTLPPAGNSGFQTHYFTGDVSIPSGTRRGLLVARGDVTLSGSSEWDGIMVVGGSLRSPAGGQPYTVYGMVITGLNLSLPASGAAPTVLSRGAGTIQWDWCYTRSSISALTFLVPVRGTYVDTWKTY